MADAWVTVTEADEVTAEILEAAESVYDGWYAGGGRIDWTDFLDRLEGVTYDSIGGRLDLGESANTPAIQRVKAHVRAYSKQ